MFKRLVLNDLNKWKERQKHIPLVIRGARQVGKTTVVHEFGKRFDNYLYFNLELKSDKEVLEMELPTDTLVALLFARKNLKKKHGSTLLFIDEIQNSPKTIARLRYLYEDRPDLYVVAAGSQLENIVDVKSSFPVGRVEYLPVRPCSFREYMMATGHESQLEIMATPEYSAPFHTEYMSYFNQYCIVGGMPEAVQQFADHGDMLAIDPVYSRLVRGYMDDVEKYTRTSKLTEVVRFLIRYAPYQAGSIITMGNFGGSEYRSREVGEAFQLLQKAMLMELVYPSTSASMPAMPELRRMPKLFWFDTGIVNYVAGIRHEVIGANDILDVWRGRVGEQIVGQELLTLNNDINQRLNFWTRGKGESGAVVDFTWAVDSKLIPIEVKTGHNAHLRSLHSFIDNAPVDIAVRVWSGAFSVDEVVSNQRNKRFRLINLPFYLVGELENIVRRYW